MTLGSRVTKVDLVVDAVPSGPVAATVKVYVVEGFSRSLVPQAPSGPARPATLPPWASSRVTAPNVPDEALTVTGASGRTSLDRSAGDTTTTAGVVTGVGVVMGSVGFAPRPELSMVEPAEPEPLPWQALSRTLSARKRTAKPRLDEELADDLKVSNRLSGHGLWPIENCRSASTPR